MNTSRILWSGCVLVVFELAILVGDCRLEAAPDSSVSASPSAGTAIKELRRKAAERQRRLIYNNDGGDVIWLTQPTAEALLQRSTTMLVGTQVDNISYCPRSVGLDSFTYFTKIGTIFTVREGHYASNQMEALVAKGIDPLRVMVDFGKRENKELFYSLRMNDTHDASLQNGHLSLPANRFKAAHPEYMLGTPTKRPKHGAWTALDYGQPEVRERVFRLFEEACRNYDIDGVELDFFRHPVFFRSTSRGESVTDEERATMTELMVRIRKMADEVGQLRGRPILISMRVPDSVEYCRAIGLDLENWMASDLLDIYVPAGYFQLNDWEYSTALGHKYGVKVYPSLDDTRIMDVSVNALRMNNLAYRARAADAWRAGADGIYLFNLPESFRTGTGLIQELGDPTLLATLDKEYYCSYRGVKNAAGGNLPYGPYLKLETLNPDNPRKIEPGKTASARLSLGENLGRETSANLKLRLKVQGLSDAAGLLVVLNGKSLTMKPGSNAWFESVLSNSELRNGSNTIEVSLTSDAKQPATWSDAVLEVRHAKKRPQ
ncbi:MAG: hypothetical protein WD468_10440 [Pirellulales bacterium]